MKPGPHQQGSPEVQKLGRILRGKELSGQLCQKETQKLWKGDLMLASPGTVIPMTMIF